MKKFRNLYNKNQIIFHYFAELVLIKIVVGRCKTVFYKSSTVVTYKKIFHNNWNIQEMNLYFSLYVCTFYTFSIIINLLYLFFKTKHIITCKSCMNKLYFSLSFSLVNIVILRFKIYLPEANNQAEIQK